MDSEYTTFDIHVVDRFKDILGNSNSKILSYAHVANYIEKTENAEMCLNTSMKALIWNASQEIKDPGGYVIHMFLEKMKD